MMAVGRYVARLYLRRERLHLNARSKRSGNRVTSVQGPQSPECVRRNRMIARPSHGACVESQIARVRDAASASKSAAALAASKESAVPLAMTSHSPRLPFFLQISQVGTPSSVNA